LPSHQGDPDPDPWGKEMIGADHLVDELQSNGFTFFCGVPDSLLNELCAILEHRFGFSHSHVISANEGSAVGMATGHFLATGHPSVVYMQNSGLGNAINPLISLADPKVYSIPMLLVIGWRGMPGAHDEPQHIKQGEITLELLDVLGIEHHELTPRTDENEMARVVKELAVHAKEGSCPVALVVHNGTFSKQSWTMDRKSPYRLSREAALKVLVETLPEGSAVVSTTGKLSRELYELRESLSQGHERDFLTVGSMGHSSQIALGLAMAIPGRSVYCLDGDGALIMHLGSATTIGQLAPGNLKHVVFNNGAHESVGGQPTAAFGLDVPRLALACGYRYAEKVEDPDELRTALIKLREERGPAMLEIRVNLSSRKDLGRPSSTPEENKSAFMSYIAGKVE
jgi:phosphonopyruvate decarboxylase